MLKKLAKDIPPVLFTVFAVILGTELISFFAATSWSFAPSSFISHPVSVYSLLLLISLTALLYYLSDRLTALFEIKFAIPLFALLIFAALFYFRYDSFVYGDGNLRINQVAMSPSIFLEWFEFGSLFLISILFKLFSATGSFDSLTQYQANLISAYNSWISFSFLMSILSLIGSIQIARLLTQEKFHQILFAIIIFFGGHSLLLFGFLGIETVVATSSIWISYFCLKIIYKSSPKDILFCWILFAVSVLFYYANIYMLPAVVYATIVGSNKIISVKKKAVVPAILIFVVCFVSIYFLAQSSFRFSQFFLTVGGMNPNSEYTLFSKVHLSDIFQALLMLFPQMLIVLYYLYKRDKERDQHSFDLKFAIILSLSGLSFLFLLNPIHGFPVDLPRFSAFLTPLSILLVILIPRYNLSIRKNALGLFLLATWAVANPVNYLGVYNNIDNADGYLESYFEENPQFYLSGCHAFRDAYFYNKEFSKADEWEWKLPIVSQDFLNFRGCTDLLASNRHVAALKILYRIIVQHPHWSEVRYQTAQAQLGLNRYELAKAQIDTSLIISPYDKDYHILNLQYYLKSGDFSGGYDAAIIALDLFPEEMDVLTEMMAIQYRMGELTIADSLATIILDKDSSIIFPLVIKGFVAEYEEKFDEAISYFELFTTKAKEDDPDLPIIRKKLNQLVLKQETDRQQKQ